MMSDLLWDVPSPAGHGPRLTRLNPQILGVAKVSKFFFYTFGFHFVVSMNAVFFLVQLF